jgi:hypothetical protein
VFFSLPGEEITEVVLRGGSKALTAERRRYSTNSTVFSVDAFRFIMVVAQALLSLFDDVSGSRSLL